MIPEVPPLLHERLEAQYGAELAREIEVGYVRKRTTFRVNPLKGDREAVLREIADAGIAVEPIAWYDDAFLLPDGRQYLPERSSLLDLLLDLRSSTDIGIFWVLPFCKQLYAEWGIQQPDVNCEYLTTALQVVCGTERKLAVRKEILQTVAEEHHTTVAAVDCGMRRLIDGVEKYNTEAWQKFKQDYGLVGHSVTLGKLIYAGRQKLIDSGTQGRKAVR